MGTRPKVMTVFGVDNYTGKRPSEELFETQVNIDGMKGQPFELSYIKDIAFDNRENVWRCFYELVYIGNDEWGNDGVIGWIKSRDFDSDTFRVMSMIYPELFETGYMDVPQEKSEWTRKMRLRNRNPIPCEEIEFQEHWLYPQGYHFMTPVWAYITKRLLDSLEMETNPKDYKWMLVWEWS